MNLPWWVVAVSMLGGAVAAGCPLGVRLVAAAEMHRRDRAIIESMAETVFDRNAQLRQGRVKCSRQAADLLWLNDYALRGWQRCNARCP